ncbi:MAG: FecR domain-containing protein [Proteobacteria bacterium]|nr:FecR domain-containing protein [Pseudomonadota bacterium]
MDSFDVTQPPLEVIDASTHVGGPLAVPASGWLMGADFAREGYDLVVSGDAGQKFVVMDYFASDTPPDLMTAENGTLRGDIVAQLAGPLNPGEYAQASGVPQSDPIGVVETLRGVAEATRADGSKVTLSQGDPIFRGDIIETGANGSVSMVMADDSVFSLDADGTVKMDELVYDPEDQEGSMSVSLVKGVFSFVSGQIAKTDPDAMVLNTPMATVGIRGTTGVMDLPEGGSVQIILAPDDNGQTGELTIQVKDASGNPIGAPITVNIPLSAVGIAPGGEVQQFTIPAAQFQQQYQQIVSQTQNAASASNNNNDGDDGGVDGDTPPDSAGTSGGDGPPPDLIGIVGNLINSEPEPEPEVVVLPQPPKIVPMPVPKPPVQSGGDEDDDDGSGSGGEDGAVTIIGTSGADSLSGGSGDDIIDGLAGDDSILGLAGNDTLTGGDGNDVVDGGTGNDFLVAGTGNGDDTYVGGDGIDTASFTSTTMGVVVNLANTNNAATGSETGTDDLFSIERVYGGSGADILSGYTGNDTLMGFGGNDTLSGGDGNDMLTGGAGDDIVSGDAGDDTLIAATGAGNDSYDGGTGTDTAVFSSATATVTVNLSMGSATGTEIGTDTLTAIENVIGGSGDDMVTGDSNANQLTGGAGNDSFVGSGGLDSYIGGAGSDTVTYFSGTNVFSVFDVEFVFGGTGDDSVTFSNGAGENIIVSGIESLTGGGGNDVYTLVDNLSAGATYDGGAGTDSLNLKSGTNTLSTMTSK